MLRPLFTGVLLLAAITPALAAPAEAKDCARAHTICVDGVNDCGATDYPLS